ncbi:hypothetical protein VNI00_017431 [Paramarasmius palmivorus]|uniref:DUF6570 domain-containing protein n=1 Tax=Paramarasmius palmivorus TaxID=297713 RepID=A0AAW0B6U3_9AGAR
MAFEAPIPKVYNMLPPPKEDIEEVLAILFTGPAEPTPEDFKYTPLLVRRNVVKDALTWLILNHSGYSDVQLSIDNLMQYDESLPPCAITWKVADSNRSRESGAIIDDDEEEALPDGDCQFTVHGITSEDLCKLTSDEITGIAAEYFDNGGKVLGIGRKDHGESIWKNPLLYPKMFPWLYPYGLGGFGTVALSEAVHKKYLLMYHDKRFQLDENFPIVAFSHGQVKSATQAGWLLADKSSFDAVADRLLKIDQTVLGNIASRMANGEKQVKYQDQLPPKNICEMKYGP